jgi:hypothetical protein
LQPRHPSSPDDSNSPPPPWTLHDADVLNGALKDAKETLRQVFGYELLQLPERQFNKVSHSTCPPGMDLRGLSLISPVCVVWSGFVSTLTHSRTHIHACTHTRRRA